MMHVDMYLVQFIVKKSSLSGSRYPPLTCQNFEILNIPITRYWNSIVINRQILNNLRPNTRMTRVTRRQLNSYLCMNRQICT